MLRFATLFRLAVLAAALLLCSAAIAQPPQSGAGPQTAPPVPHALRAARSIFVGNAGGDSWLFPAPFTGNPSRGYTEFYDALKSAGYDLVDDPAKADLVLELRLTGPNFPRNADVVGAKLNSPFETRPMFRLVIYQASTHFVLWALTESIDPALLQKTHDRNFDVALQRLLTDFEEITGHAPQPAP